MCDDMLSFAFIKSTIDPSKIFAANTFLQFVNTDISLIEYTETTNTPKALLYEIPDKSKLSNYGRSFMTLRENSDIVFAYNGADIYCNNAASFGIYTWQTQVDGTVYKNPIEPLRNGASVKDVFDGIVKNGETLWNNMIK